jgi:hypothetical protein
MIERRPLKDAPVSPHLGEKPDFHPVPDSRSNQSSKAKVILFFKAKLRSLKILTRPRFFPISFGMDSPIIGGKDKFFPRDFEPAEEKGRGYRQKNEKENLLQTYLPKK